ncbi:MAG: thioredoxin domain-containing protein [Gemmatimonadetes bacterium]|nr:thioredoxin domain-containing protein [Gemmatimonadota bacterium]
MKIRCVATFLVVAAVVACGGGPAPDDASTEELNRELLTQPVTDGRTTPVAVDPSLTQEGPRVPVAQVGINRGSAEAPVKVVELSDYGCGYCRQFHQETFPTLMAEFIETGMVEWKFVPFVTGMFENSIAVTEAAECVYGQDPNAFDALSDRIWDEQSTWKGSDEPAAVVRPWVAELGVDMDSFDSCLANDEQLSRVASSTTLAQQLGVRGTPTFVVVGYPPLQGALPLELFQEVLTAVHAQNTGAAPAPGEEGGR